MTATADQLEIRPAARPVNAVIAVPGSKSITNRALVLTALAEGTSTLDNALFSEDSHWCIDCLRRLGIAVETDEANARITIHGRGGAIPAESAELFVGNSGTTARFVVAAAALGKGEYTFDGVPRMRERPIGEQVRTLRELGAAITSERFPLTVKANGLRGGAVSLDATDSSQFLSAILQVAPYCDSDVTLDILGEIVSVPYIDITLKMMAQFGVSVDNSFYRKYTVHKGQRYRAQAYVIEPDASNATYFFAAAALTGGRVRVPHLTADAMQGDAHFVDVLEQMGCTVERGADYLEVRGVEGGSLRGIDINLNAMSDTAQTLAAIAPFADSPTTIRDIGHIRHKETDRIHAIVTELRRLGVRVDETPDSVMITPAPAITPAAIHTYDDHRMAMAFSVIGLRVPGIVILDPGCTRKTFPDYFERFAKLYE
jgi:3-phosphoshikimate 1-carboxyvinyltransferase